MSKKSSCRSSQGRARVQASPEVTQALCLSSLSASVSISLKWAKHTQLKGLLGGFHRERLVALAPSLYATPMPRGTVTWVPPGNLGMKPNQQEKYKNNNLLLLPLLPPSPLLALLPLLLHSSGKNSHSTTSVLPTPNPPF